MIGFRESTAILVLRLPPSPYRAYLPPSFILSMSHEESDSLEEINKQRIALGLKPLSDDKAPEDTPEKRAEANYAQQREKEAQEKEKKYVYSHLALPPH